MINVTSMGKHGCCVVCGGVEVVVCVLWCVCFVYVVDCVLWCVVLLCLFLCVCCCCWFLLLYFCCVLYGSACILLLGLGWI